LWPHPVAIERAAVLTTKCTLYGYYITPFQFVPRNTLTDILHYIPPCLLCAPHLSWH